MPQPPGLPLSSTGGEGPGQAGEAQAQNHPLYSLDRGTIDRLLAAKVPGDEDLVDAARLLSRYEGFPGALDLKNDLERVIRLWGLTRETLQAQTRSLWQSGYRPGVPATTAEPVGSGFDASDEGA